MTNVKLVLAQKRKLQHKSLKPETTEDGEKAPETPEERSRRLINRKLAQKNRNVNSEEDGDEESSDSDSDSDDNKKKKHHHKKSKKEDSTSFFGRSPTIKIISLILLIPLVMSIPFVLSHICIFVEEKLPKYTIEGIWCIYIPIMLFIAFYVRRDKTTISSFATHIMIYLIIALGIYNFVHVAQSVPLRYRRNALKLWLTITNIFNIAAFLIDDTDYKAKEEKEKEKERRKEERRKKRQEEREQRKKEIPPEQLPFYKRNKVVKIICDLLIYAIILGVLVWITFVMKEKYENFTAENQKSWGYESNTGENWKHDLKDDDLHDVHVAENVPGEENANNNNNENY